MIELTPADRLKTHLILNYPRVKMKHVRLSDEPGFLQTSPDGRIDIRGAGYAKGNPSLRLWNELHRYFTQHVEVVKLKNGLPTLIAWNGLIYHLDQSKSFKPIREQVPVARRNHPQRTRKASRKGVNM